MIITMSGFTMDFGLVMAIISGTLLLYGYLEKNSAVYGASIVLFSAVVGYSMFYPFTVVYADSPKNMAVHTIVLLIVLFGHIFVAITRHKTNQQVQNK